MYEEDSCEAYGPSGYAKEFKQCDICQETNSHLAGCPIGENKVMKMPPLKEVKPQFLCGCGSGAQDGQCNGMMCNPEANK